MGNIPRVKLNTGASIPAIGFGTWRLEEGNETEKATLEALKIGYRLIDTAKLYGNEKSVGEAVRKSGISREEIFVTTKLWTSANGYKNSMDEFNESLKRLALDYVDLYLIHSPRVTSREESWRALEDIYKTGKARAVGVSNYAVKHLEELLSNSELIPAVNQIEFHPFIYKNMKPILDFCKAHGIVVEAYSPLARGRFESELIVNEIAASHGKTGGQVMLRWALQHGTIPIPKSTHPSRIKENFEVFDFELSGEEMQALDNLSSGGFIVTDPSTID